MKALGIVAMILAIIDIFIPVIGVYLTVLAALFAAFAAGEGLVFAAVAILLNLVNLVFLSPSLWVTEVGVRSTGHSGPGIFLVAIQIVAAVIVAVIHRSKKRGKISSGPPSASV